MLEKASQGHWPSTAPYGYRNNKDTRLVEVDELKSAYVKRVFALYASGEYSLKRVIDKMHEEGFVFRVSTPKPPLSNMHHILTNIFYTGRFIFKGMEYVGHHQPLVSSEVFRRVQRVLKSGNKPDYARQSLAYANLITCGHCGCTVVGEIKQNGDTSIIGVATTNRSVPTNTSVKKSFKSSFPTWCTRLALMKSNINGW